MQTCQVILKIILLGGTYEKSIPNSSDFSFFVERM
jgi:hypothetical protein